MDTNNYTISYASFIAKVYYWLVSYLKRKGAFKYVLLLMVVLCCTFARYVVLSLDKTILRQVKAMPVSIRRVKLPLTSVTVKSELAEMRQKYQRKIKPLNIRKEKSSPLYIYAVN